MKLIKMSLATALLMTGTTTLFAIDKVKVEGDAKLFYSTGDDGNNDLFGKDGAAGQTAASISISADLMQNVSTGVQATALSALGLQNNIVSNVWEQADSLHDTLIVNEAWISGTTGSTTGKIGRMSLETPLVFSETWSIVANTFEAVLLENKDIPATTVTLAYIGASNGSSSNQNGGYAGVLSDAQLVDANGSSTTFHSFYKGAYAIGAQNNSWKPLTLKGWYYRLQSVSQAYWLEADLNIRGILAGFEYTSGKQKLGNDEWSGTFAGMIGYELLDEDKKEIVTIKGSYSQTSDKGSLHGANIATATGASNIYSEAWWNYGYITRSDTTAYNATLHGTLKHLVDLGLYYTGSKTQIANANDVNMNEIVLTANRKFGKLDTTLAYIRSKADDVNSGNAYNILQAYFTLNF